MSHTTTRRPTTTAPFFFACCAMTDFGGRCRNPATDKSCFCAQHLGMEHTSVVAPADVTLLKCKLAPKWDMEWPQAFLAAGFQRAVAEKTREQKFAEAEAQAKRAGRSADVYQQSGQAPRKDAGVAVFGKNGLSNIRLLKAFDELVAYYGGVSSIQLVTGKEDAPVLEIAFSKGAPPATITDEMMTVLAEYLGLAAFRWVMVFSNPPGEDDRRTDTINADKRSAEDEAKLDLRFANGTWSVDPLNN